jgi:signal transduction histidine kinase
MMGNAAMKDATGDNLSAGLADAIRNISAMISSGADYFEIASAAVQCAVTMLPGARAVVVELHSQGNLATVLAAVNAPFINPNQEIELAEDSILLRAKCEPFRVHHESYSDKNRLFPAATGFPGDSDDVISAKAVSRADRQSVVLVLVSDPETASQANSVLMTLSELLMALCAGQEAALLHGRGLLDIARAKQEWEKTVDALPEVVCLVDQDGNVVRANRTIERWGLGAVNTARGKHVHALFHQDCDTAACPFRDAVSLTLAAQAANGYIESAITDSTLGRTMIVHTRLMTDLPMAATDNSHPCAIVVVSDISALQTAQRDLSDLNQDLERRVLERTAELEDSNRDLAEEVARRSVAENELQVSRDELANLSQQLINAQEDERRRLSRELHDSLGQSLGAIKYSLERVAAMHENPEHGDPANEIGGIIENVGLAIKETRSMAVSLRPPLLDDIGTAAAIGWLCQHFADTFSEIKFHIDVDVPNSDIPESLSTPVYRIVQEALNNVVKHAAARTVMVALRFDEGTLRLEVLDDGVGFDNSANDTGSFKRLGKIGRLGMRERALNSNGHLTIESWPGEGTKVKGEWSLHDFQLNMEQ